MDNTEYNRMKRFIDENYAYEYILWTLAFDDEDRPKLREIDDPSYDY